MVIDKSMLIERMCALLGRKTESVCPDMRCQEVALLLLGSVVSMK